MKQFNSSKTNPLPTLLVRNLLYITLFLAFYLLISSSQAYSACWEEPGGSGQFCRGVSLESWQVDALGVGGCPALFPGGSVSTTVCCDNPQDYCNKYSVRQPVCGNAYESMPQCAVCSEGVLKCSGNNYRLCDTDPFFPADAEFFEDRSGYLPSPSSGSVTFNGVPYSAPPEGIYFCDSNLFGCGDNSCTGGQSDAFMGGECPAAFGFIGGTYFNACAIGPLCDLDEQYYSPGDFIIGDTLTFAVGEFPKRAPHPQYEAFKHFICPQSECDPVSATSYCERGTVKQCQNFAAPDPLLTPWFQCDPNGADGEDAGWIPLPPPNPLSPYVPVGSCEDMQTQMPVAFTPGYVLTMIPHLQSIWENTVNRPNAIFTPFRTARTVNTNDEGQLEVNFQPVEEWPGESYFDYSFDGGWAMAGDPNEIDPPDQAAVYFRYLGFLLCSRENLIDKLSPFTANPSYQYYEPRCDNFIW